MDTKSLEDFAKWARRELLSVVDAQGSAVLASGSVPRTERPDAVRRLESEIGTHGRQHVIDKVAYTWFNRIIALRFMDARGYTDAGVVSPVRGQEQGQPEILSDAKRGNLDPDVIPNTRTADAILGLFDGTRHSRDADSEAYALLLTEYCRYWHKSMPFMFEREGDYTELLMPANLLADGAILSRARDVLTEDVCDNVEVIGWLYQFYISERKREIFDSKAKRGVNEIPATTQLFTPHWIVRYLVENSIGRLWMLNHPESRLIDQMDYYIAPVDEQTEFLKIMGPEDLTVMDPACGSGHMLTYAFDLLYAIYEEVGYSRSEIPGLILTHNLYGTEIDSRAGTLAAFALTMKARAKQRTFFNRKIKPQICIIEPISFRPDEIEILTAEHGDDIPREEFFNQFVHADTFGSLIQPDASQTMNIKAAVEKMNSEADILYTDTVNRARKLVGQIEILSAKYTVVIANPPYMWSSHMDSLLSEFAKSNFPDNKSDLFAMFIERCLLFLDIGGYAGLMTPYVWMFISSYEKLRNRLLKQETISSLIQLEYSGFEGATVPICTFILRHGASGGLGAFVRLSDFVGAASQGPKALEIITADRKRRAGETTNGMERHLYRVSSEELQQIPGSPIAYWLSDAVRGAFTGGRALKDMTSPRVGLQTGDNVRFVRQWWEVSQARSEHWSVDGQASNDSNARWFPYTDGGDFRRWYGNRWAVVNWEEGGKELHSFKGSVIRNPGYYFAPSVSWSAVGSGVPAFRSTPAGSVFSNAGMSLFGTNEQLESACAVCNSTTAEKLFAAIAPTLNLGVGEIGRLPIASVQVADRRRVQTLVNCARQDWDDFETSADFKRPSWLGNDVGEMSFPERYRVWSASQVQSAREQQSREMENNLAVAEAYGLRDEVPVEVPLAKVSLDRNVEFLFGAGKSIEEYATLERAAVCSELVSYAVGCIFGRYSIEEPGLILANQGATLQDYLAELPSPTFVPDADNVIPFVDDGWFKDDIVERFREVLLMMFGAEHFEENLRFIEESLGVKTLRDYFITKNGTSKFYNDHVKRYKKRPIYWMFSSPKGSFNALIYMHRYTPSTVSTVLNEYLREYRAKLEVALTEADKAAAGGSAKNQKEADRLRKVLVELAEYEHDVLYPLATRQLPIDLDDGVLVNYLRFGPALKNIGLENNRKKVEGWEWPVNKLEPFQ